MQNLRPLTATKNILDAIREGRSILLFRFSLLGKDLLDVQMKIPSLKEIFTIKTLQAAYPHLREDLAEECIYEHVLYDEQKFWLLNKAPAGFLYTVFNTIQMIGCPTTEKDLNGLMQITRTSQNLFDKLGAILSTTVNYDPEVMKKMDVYQFFQLLSWAEPALLAKKILKKEFVFESETQKKKRSPYLIDTEAENKGLLEDEISHEL